MLALRVARGARPLGQLVRLLVACASAGAGFLLLAALARALAHPHQSGESVRLLLWCLLPLAAAVQFAVTVGRAVPGARSRSGMAAAGLGPSAGTTALAAVSTAVACVLGSAVALLVFLHLRGELTGLPFDGAAVRLLAADRPLPVAAVLTLLCAAPLAATAAAAFVTRRPAAHGGVLSSPALPWGVALLAGGLTLERFTAHPAGGSGELPAGVAAGFLLVAAGLVLVGPAVVHLSGGLLSAHRPGVVRLLAGRALQRQAALSGRIWGGLCAVTAGLLTAAALPSVRDATVGAGPLPVLGAALVVCCPLASALTAAAGLRRARRPARRALESIGTPRGLQWKAAALRSGTLLTALLLTACGTAVLVALPLG